MSVFLSQHEEKVVGTKHYILQRYLVYVRGGDEVRRETKAAAEGTCCVLSQMFVLFL